jgi:hypothetical protein
MILRFYYVFWQILYYRTLYSVTLLEAQKKGQSSVYQNNKKIILLTTLTTLAVGGIYYWLRTDNDKKIY